MKVICTLCLVLLLSGNAWAKYAIDNQVDRLRQYVGHWVSSIHPDTEEIDTHPAIKMRNIALMGNQSIQVEVLSLKEGTYHPILAELIGYDTKSDQIIAVGQNSEGVFFKGTGHFESENTWKMKDVDMKGNFYLRVEFDFNSPTTVFLEGFDENDKSLWKVRYIKANPKDKNIGVQLVSVHQNMLNDPSGTLQDLSRMGFSFVETFVYKDGTFYGMTPKEFKALVEGFGMQFLGSMTFHTLPSNEEWESALQWWNGTIDDHVDAGVEYLTTSNNQLKTITSKAELERFTDYYNAIGKLCRKKGITFAFHNHADEFRFVDGVRIYDYFLENTNPEYVYFQADTYWMNVAGVDPLDYFTKFPTRFLSWHIKDHKELGDSGKINWDSMFNQPGYNLPKYKVVEVEDYSYPPMYSVQLAWEYLYYEILL